MSRNQSDNFGFSNHVIREINRQHLDLDPTAYTLLMGIANDGARTLARRGREASTEQALRNLYIIIDRLAMKADGNTITAGMVRDVMAGICPLWPFC